MSGERTEAPTQRRRDDARHRGQVAVSREVDSALVLLAAYFAFRFSGERLWGGLEALLRDTLTQASYDTFNPEFIAQLGSALVWRAIVLLAPLFGFVAVFGTLSGFAQGGGIFALQAIAPNPSKMNPIAGFRRTFMSKQSVVQLAKTLAKFAIIGSVVWITLRDRMAELTSLGVSTSIPAAASTMYSIGTGLALRVLIVLIGIAVIDMLFQRYELLSQLRMTRQEVRDEARQQEGDPEVKARIARVRRSFLARIMQAVPQADVVLMNPTHYAVALKYDAATSAAPKVIAKGENLLAMRIRDLAKEHGIPVIQNPPLTRAIYKAVPVGREITPDLYEAVAAVLAFVYRLRYAGGRVAA